MRKLVMPEELKVEIIGDDQIIERLAVAAELLLILLAVQVFADVFRFDIADRNFAFRDDKIRVAARRHVGRFVDDLHIRRKRAKHVFEVGAVGVFFRHAALIAFLKLRKVVVYGHDFYN